MKHLDTSYRIVEGIDAVFRVEYRHQSGNTVTLVQYNSLAEAKDYVKGEVSKANKLMKQRAEKSAEAKVVFDWKDSLTAKHSKEEKQ